MAYTNGFGGTLLVGVAVMNVEQWSIDLECEPLDTTNVGTGGFVTYIAGAKKAAGSAKAFYDPAAPYQLAPLSITVGTVATITLNIGLSAQFITASVLFTKVHMENAAKGVVPFDIDFVVTGVWTNPV